MLILTAPNGSAVYASLPDIAEVRAGALSEFGSGCRLFLASGDVVPVREDVDAVEAMLAEAGLSGFERPDTRR